METNKMAAELKAGDVIRPPAGERVWLKSDMTVISTESVKQARGLKQGDWIKIKASFVSPYRKDDSSEISEMEFFMLSDKLVSVSCSNDKVSEPVCL